MKYKRILLKLSGESLQGKNSFGIDTTTLTNYAQQIKEVNEAGIQLAIVVGGGNIFRGLRGVDKGFDRVKGDYMGMLATVINGLALQSALESIGAKARVITAIKMEPVAIYYNKQKCIDFLKNGEIVIFTFGTGNPYFTTDTASALRAIEIEADILLKGTQVDGVYSADPKKVPTAQKFDELTFNEAITKQLNVLDLTAFTLCMENNIPVLVFDIHTQGNLMKAVKGEKIGSLVFNK